MNDTCFATSHRARGYGDLEGLTEREAVEFEMLEETVPFEGRLVWPTTGLPGMESEQRWLELWTKHRTALLADMNNPR
jgi:hypothetical protein